MAEYRPIPDDRAGDLQRATQYAFSPSQPAESAGFDAGIEDLSERARLGSPRGLFADDGTLLSTCKHYWHTVSVRGDDHPVAGLAGVATPPEHRRQGHVAELIAESLAEYRERDQSFTILWPFEFEFYRRYGWARAGTLARYECGPTALRTVADRTNDEGRFRRLDTNRLDTDTIEALDGILDAYNERFELTLRRSEAWWHHRIFEGYEQDPYVYGWERDGELRGYVVYTIHEGEEPTLDATDLAYVDRTAWIHLLGFLADHDAQVERVRIEDAPSTWLLDLVADPDAIECTFFPGPMVRIVDVQTALEGLSYPPDIEAEFTLSVTDPTADWNHGRFVVAVSDGTATCRPVEGDGGGSTNGADGTQSDVRTDINTLSQLCVGHGSVERAAFTGEFSVESEELERVLDAGFPPGEVFFREFF